MRVYVCACVSVCDVCVSEFVNKTRTFSITSFKVSRNGTEVELPEHCINCDIAITIASLEPYHLSVNTPKHQRSKTLLLRLIHTLTTPKTAVRRNDAVSI